jgi:hypothetical protein
VAIDSEFLMAMGNLDSQADFNGAQMLIHGATYMAKSGVVGGAECVAQNQVDNPLKFPQ